MYLFPEVKGKQMLPRGEHCQLWGHCRAVGLALLGSCSCSFWTQNRLCPPHGLSCVAKHSIHAQPDKYSPCQQNICIFSAITTTTDSGVQLF